jgi:hypothetical protein
VARLLLSHGSRPASGARGADQDLGEGGS